MKKYFLIAALSLLMPSTHAFALELKPNIGIGLGMYGLEYDRPGVNQRNSLFGGYVKLGLDVHENLAVEMRLGRTSGKGSALYPAGTMVGVIPSPVPFSFSISTNYIFSLLAKPQLELAADFQAYGLLGATTAKITGENSLPIIAPSAVNNVGFSYGVGAEYKLADKVLVGAEWVQYWKNVNAGSAAKAAIWSVAGTVAYKF